MIRDKPPLLYADDIETVPANEADDIERVVEATRLLLARHQAKSGEFVADVHVKAHGYAEGKLSVLPNLPDELAQGLFEHEAVYRTVVRFSNAASQPQADALPDGRGMAMKVMGVTGDDWNPWNWHWREMLTVARIAGHLPAHPASNTYFSASPIRFGKYVAKYRARPVGDRLDSYLDLIKRLGAEADAMRLALEETLRTQEILFEFQVQLRSSEQTMPIEDPTVEWPESESPYRTVAHLLLPRQEIAPLRMQAAYQNLAFNVWHALAAHRPLGGINRSRRSVYPVSSAWRRRQQ